jgi:hypothetical protein
MKSISGGQDAKKRVDFVLEEMGRDRIDPGGSAGRGREPAGQRIRQPSAAPAL